MYSNWSHRTKKTAEKVQTESCVGPYVMVSVYTNDRGLFGEEFNSHYSNL